MDSRIAIFHTKYKNFYFNVSNPELMAEACLAMLYFNRSSGLYIEPPNPTSFLTIQEQDLLSINEEELDALHPNFKKELEKIIKPLRKQAALYKQIYDQNFKWMRKMESLMVLPFEEAAVERTVDEKGKRGGYLSTALIEERIDFPYQGYQLVDLDHPVDIWNS